MDEIERRKKIIARFETKYVPEPMSGCYIWIAGLNKGGYGKFKMSQPRQTKAAYKVAYELFIGPVPPGLQLDHKCRVRCCVNPYHLEPVTNKENLARGINANRIKEYCPYGHPYAGDNVYRRFNKGCWARFCRTCERIRNLRYYHERRGQSEARWIR